MDEDIDDKIFDEENVDNQSEEIKSDIEGFLQKRKGNNKNAPKEKYNWSLRYFILKEGTLHIYKNPSDSNPQKSLDLSTLELDANSQLNFNENSFVLKNSKMFLILASSTKIDRDRWISNLQENKNKPHSQPPKKINRDKGFSVRTKSAIGEKVISSSIGKSILKETMNEDAWFIMNNIKIFISKESGEKVGKIMYNDILKFVAKVYILCKEGLLTPDYFWTNIKDPLWKTFSLLIDSFELSFAFDPSVLAKDVAELSITFEKIFIPLMSTSSIQSLKSIFDYFSKEKVWEKLYTDENYTQEISSTVKTLRKLWNEIKFPNEN